MQLRPAGFTLVKSVVWSTLGGIAFWIGLLIQMAYHMRAHTAELGGHVVQVGPLALTILSKQPIEGGFIVQFSIRPGLIYFLLACAGLGLVLGWLANRVKSILLAYKNSGE